jgi:hypothetical protein
MARLGPAWVRFGVDFARFFAWLGRAGGTCNHPAMPLFLLGFWRIVDPVFWGWVHIGYHYRTQHLKKMVDFISGTGQKFVNVFAIGHCARPLFAQRPCRIPKPFLSSHLRSPSILSPIHQRQPINGHLAQPGRVCSARVDLRRCRVCVRMKRHNLVLRRTAKRQQLPRCLPDPVRRKPG